MALPSIVEKGWPLGSFQAGAVELEPPGSAQTIKGLLGDDGLPYRRGGVSFKSNAAAGTGGVAWVWDGYFPVLGQRTVYSATSTSKLYTLSGDDTTPINTNGSAPGTPVRPVLVGGLLVMSSGAVYGGSRRTAAYTTGTVTVTNGSATVTGVGTTWTTNADVGTIFVKTSGATPYNPYVVKSIDTNTQITLDRPFAEVTAAGVNYSLAPTGGPSAPQITYPFTQIANRLVGLSATATEINRLNFSSVGDPNTVATTDYHTFPGQILGLAALRDTLLVFTTSGVWSVSNLAMDLSDTAGNPQQRREVVNADLIAWGHEGIAPWRGNMLVPALDGVWMIDGISAPTRISDRIADLYLGHVRAGNKAGVAEVFSGHYLLPILNSSNVWQDTLVARLTETHQGPAFSWSQLNGFGATVTGYAERSSAPPVLLGASTAASSRVLNATSYFSPAAAVKQDADASTHTFQFVTRDIEIGPTATAIRWIRGVYSLVAASAVATITAEVSVDGAAYTTLTVTTGTAGGTTAGEQDGHEPVYWEVNKAGRFVRFRFTCSDAADSLQFKQLEVFYRPQGN